ncbi:MAG: PAS domain S-box protein [Candidatus Kapabacteria bacterium]|nr:PAS domain S-box protein [Candidatus Kapabacteria bacterium]
MEKLLFSSLVDPKSSGLIKTILNLIPNPIFIKDREGRYVDCNKAFEEFTGFSCEEIVGKTAFDFYSQKDAEYFTAKDQELINYTVETQTFEYISLFKSSDIPKYVIFNKTLLKNDKGEIIGILGVITDITKRKKIEQELFESQEKFRTLVHNAPISITITNLDGTTIFANDTARKWFSGESGKGSIEGKNIFDPEIIENKDQLINLRSKLMNENRINNLLLKINRPDGTKYITDNNIALIRDKDGIPLYVIAFSLDITQRLEYENELIAQKEKAEEQEHKLQEMYNKLSRQNEFIQKILDNLPIGIALNDTNTEQAIYYNKKFEEIYGWGEEDIYSIDSFFEKIFPDENYRKEIYERVMNDIRSGDPNKMHWENVVVTRKDGSKRVVNAVNIPLFEQNTMVSTVMDITKLHEYQQELINAKKEIEESSEFFRKLYEDSYDPILLMKDNKFINCNDATIKLLGFDDKSKIIGAEVKDISPTHQPNGFRSDELAARHISLTFKKGYHRFDWRCLKSDNTLIDLEVTLMPITLKGIEYLYVTWRDITERKIKELKLLEYKQMIEQSPNSIVITDLKGNIKYVNPKFSQLTGYTKEDVIGKNPRILKSGLQGREFYENLWNTILSGNIWRGEFCNKKKNGELYWEQASICPIKDRNGDVIQFLAIKVDITDKKYQEEYIKNNEKMFRTITSAASDAVILINHEDRILQWNKAATRIFGFTRKEAINHTLHNLIVPEELRETAKQHLAIFKTSGTGNAVGKTIVLNGLKKDGSIVTVELSLSAVKIWNKWHAVGIVRDVTEKIKIQNELKELTARYQAILESVPDIIIELDTNLYVQWINRAGLDFFGDDIVGQSLITRFENSEEFYNKHQCLLNSNTKKIYIESRVKANDGSIKLLAIWSRVIKDKNKEILGFLSTARDITDYEEMKNQLNHASKMESIGQLAAGIAHEINTPLQYISNGNFFMKYAINSFKNYFDNYNKLDDNTFSKNSNEKLNLKVLLDEATKSIDRTTKGVENVSRIVKALKNFAHPSKGIKNYSNINDGINDTIVISHNEWKYVAKIETNLDNNLPLVYCCLDEINQVVLNMIINSVHAIESRWGRNIEIGKIFIESKQKEDFVEITIKDNGIGIPDKHKPKLFDLFFTTKEVGKGTGQGLAIAYDIIVNKHNGFIQVNSKEGEGAEFKIILPINPKEEKK